MENFDKNVLRKRKIKVKMHKKDEDNTSYANNTLTTGSNGKAVIELVE